MLLFNVNYYVDYAMDYAPKVVGALLVLIIGLWVISLITKGFGRMMKKQDTDPSLQGFLKSMVSILLKVLLFISVMSMMGIAATSFIAILGAAGLAVGLALQGTLQNFAGGVIILLFKPYTVGDFVEGAGHMGTVKEIKIFTTILNTPDNKIIIIPNAQLSNSSLTNFSAMDTRRVDFTFGIGYGDDYDKAKKTLLDLINADERIMKDPEPFIALSELADSSVNIVVRVWAKGADYWGIYFDMNEKVYKTFTQAGLNIPFPQMDVHLIK
ncbi:MAG: mechanosensitive ion channel family protein [Bacteroidetes bacterium]|nr:MAG: mechanosensitive ion channel family protein [Bacteroidota bacterium]RLD80722.1 MAG: mechanosensitive ion channel family protein [Bacteroidota bacterium]